MSEVRHRVTTLLAIKGDAPGLAWTGSGWRPLITVQEALVEIWQALYRAEYSGRTAAVDEILLLLPRPIGVYFWVWAPQAGLGRLLTWVSRRGMALLTVKPRQLPKQIDPEMTYRLLLRGGPGTIPTIVDQILAARRWDLMTSFQAVFDRLLPERDNEDDWTPEHTWDRLLKRLGGGQTTIQAELAAGLEAWLLQDSRLWWRAYHLFKYLDENEVVRLPVGERLHWPAVTALASRLPPALLRYVLRAL